jgi:hypothetical protein
MVKRVMGNKIRFFSPVAIKFFNDTLSNWPDTIKNKKNIIFLPCASTKPIQNSLTHCYLSPITRLYDEHTLILIVSEPLTLIPYNTPIYPNYEYAPEDLDNNQNEYEEFVKRLHQFKELTSDRINCYYIGGIHHYKILNDAGWNINYYKPRKGLIDYRDKALELRRHLFHKKRYKKIRFSTKKLTRRIVVLDSVIS